MCLFICLFVCVYCTLYFSCSIGDCILILLPFHLSIISPQRNENRLASLDPLVLQEHKFLKIFVARVAALRPNVLLVEKTVSRLAQDMLLQHGITLALNVKPVSREKQPVFPPSFWHFLHLNLLVGETCC